MKQVWTKLTCLSCHSEIIQVVNTFLNAGVDKSCKQRILNDELFTAICPKCHEKVPLIYPCVYKDQSKNLLIYLKQVQPVTSTHIHQRLAMNLDEMKELILIYEASCDDRVIYQLKDKLRARCEKINPVKSIVFKFADEEYIGFEVNYQIMLIPRDDYEKQLKLLSKEEFTHIYHNGIKLMSDKENEK